MSYVKKSRTLPLYPKIHNDKIVPFPYPELIRRLKGGRRYKHLTKINQIIDYLNKNYERSARQEFIEGLVFYGNKLKIDRTIHIIRFIESLLEEIEEENDDDGSGDN